MSHPRPIVLFLFALFATGTLAQTPSAKTSRSSGSAINFESGIKPLLSEYCFGCHGNGKKKGDIALDQWRDEAAAVHDSATWQRVLKMIQDGAMPPENKPQLSAAERARLTKWIETKVFQFDCEHPDPGRAPIR